MEPEKDYSEFDECKKKFSLLHRARRYVCHNVAEKFHYERNANLLICPNVIIIINICVRLVRCLRFLRGPLFPSIASGYLTNGLAPYDVLYQIIFLLYATPS